MHLSPRPSPLAIDLTRLEHRAASLYSNLVTRPTGRAIRMGVEQQLVELTGSRAPCLSILDFSQVRVLDYSCADEIVAKLLLRYVALERPGEVYFLARGLDEYHLESVEAVLERHRLLLAAEDERGVGRLVGPVTEVERESWRVLLGSGPAPAPLLSREAGIPLEQARATLERFVRARVVAPMTGDLYCAIPRLAHG